MKQYICLNHGECNWADETPPREFSLPDGDDQACPNCESTNIKEKPKPSGPLWQKVTGVVGLLILLAGIIWYWLSPDPLILKAESNCETGLITLITEGGDGSAVVYGAMGSKSAGSTHIFQIPKDQQNGSKLMFFAAQNGDTVKTEHALNCINQGGSGGGGTDVEGDPGPKPGGGKPTPVVKWTRVVGSEFCVSNCVQTYNETDNLGHIRERKVKNCADCQMDEK